VQLGIVEIHITPSMALVNSGLLISTSSSGFIPSIGNRWIIPAFSASLRTQRRPITSRLIVRLLTLGLPSGSTSLRRALMNASTLTRLI